MVGDVAGLLPTPAAGFDDPLALLQACHERIRKHLDLLERLAAHMTLAGTDDEARRAAASVLRYFSQAGVHHHDDEEQDLFPRLREQAGPTATPALECLVEQLSDEHGRLMEAWERLVPSLERICEGGEASLDAMGILAFVQPMREHLAVEESRLLPLAARILSTTELGLIGRAMARRRGVAWEDDADEA
jgi:hemerythrin-like domain-containing protein